jgi:ribonuclease T1
MATAAPRSRLAVLGFALVLAWAALVATTFASARAPRPALPDVALADLPSEARATHALILRGGPFRYERDGIVFGNRERLLPPRSRGYYHEYTVPTPGASGRGARRIVCGGRRDAPDACYYSDDHYRSYRRIRP